MSSDRNTELLSRISKYCGEIKEAITLFGDSYEVFVKTAPYRNAVAMCVLQIGELSGHLTADFREQFDDIPWRSIKGARNFMAHNYGELKTEILWRTVHEDIPQLADFCESVLKVQ